MQKTAYELRISDWSSDVCSSDLRGLWLGLGGWLSGLILFRQAVARRRELALRDRFIAGKLVTTEERLDKLTRREAGERLLEIDWKSIVTGKSASVCVEFGERRHINKKTNIIMQGHEQPYNYDQNQNPTTYTPV